MIIIIIIIVIVIMIIIIAFFLKAHFENFDNLFSALLSVSNTYTPVARMKLCANHVQHIEHLSHATCHVPTMCNTLSTCHMQHVMCKPCATH